MKFHCHCGLERHRQHVRAKKLGLAGVVLMGLHILFHVAECLILPSLLVALGGHAVEEDALAKSQFESISVESESKTLCTDRFNSSIILNNGSISRPLSYPEPCAPKSNLDNVDLVFLLSL